MKKLLLMLGLILSSANSQTLEEKLDKSILKSECKNLASLVVGAHTDYNLARAEEPKVKLKITTKYGYLGLVDIKIDSRTFYCIFRKQRTWKIIEIGTMQDKKQLGFVNFEKFKKTLR